MMPLPPYSRSMAALACVALLSGCLGARQTAVDALPDDATGRTMMLAETKDMLDSLDAGHPAPTAAPAVAALTGRGFAQVAGQPGATVNERRLLAMRAARLDALRDLTEQVHGIRISSTSLMRDAVLRNDQLAAQVEGTLRGARTVSIEPKGEDGYSVVMELDADTVAYIVRALGKGA
jgi:outer membrane protein FlgP